MKLLNWIRANRIFFKESGFNSFSVLVKLASGFVNNKVISMSLGAGGLGLISQMQAYFNLIQGIATAPVSLALIKQGSKDSKVSIEVRRTYTTALVIGFILAFVLTAFTLILSDTISKWLFDSTAYSNVLRFLSIFIYVFVINSFILSVVNLEGRAKRYSYISFISSIILVTTGSFLVFYYKLVGGFLSLVIPHFFISILSFYYLSKFRIFGAGFMFKFSDFDKIKCFLLLKTSIATVSISVLGLFAQISLRKYLLGQLNWSEIGIWDAVNKLSFLYLVLFNSIVQLYFFPKFSRLAISEEYKESMKLLVSAFRVIYPILIAVFVLVFFARRYIIEMVFSIEFDGMLALIPFQLTADFFKVGGFILGNFLISQAFQKKFVLFEVSFTLLYFVLSVSLIPKFGLLGLCLADIIKSFLYFVLLGIVLLKIMNKVLKGGQGSAFS